MAKAAPDLRELSNVAAGLARQQAATLVVGLSTTKRNRLRSLLARSLDQSWSDARLCTAIADVVGLDDRYANAVENYRASLLAQGISPGKAKQASLSYAKRLLQRRASTIGANETQKAMLDAQRLLWEQQRVDGEVSPYAVRVWRTHPDERRCPICRPMDGVKASLKPGGGYTMGGGIGRLAGPPAHPSCRCYEDIVDQGILKAMEVEKMEHEPLGTPGGKKNWVDRAGQLPAYIQHIANDLHTERGMDLSRAIAVAISRVKLWAAGGGHVKPDTQAKAAAAVAEWESLKAKTHAQK